MISQIHGILGQLPCLISSLLMGAGLLAMGFVGAPFIVWTLALPTLMFLFGFSSFWIWFVFIPMAVLNLPFVRRSLISKNVMKILQAMKILPVISETEKIALEAGSIWLDGELFSGNPNFKKILSEPFNSLSEKEKKFLEHQVHNVCQLMDDQKAYKEGDLSKELWDYLKKERFLGLIIPEEYGGLGFSALGHSEVVSKLASRSVPLCITVMVPNSLGPAELIIHYGTKEQKDYYLPRLASGLEIPCFALTEPGAGSDAGSMTSWGEVFKGDDGKLYIKLNWKKRYITLGAISTVIGLAVKLKDPSNLLGKGKDLGITCVLVPSAAKGVVLGRRHDPLGVPFYNCPIEGHDVVIDVDQIIGGREFAGKGWQMLMESLAAGRSISLPASSTGGSKMALRVAGAYVQIRKQFGLSVGKFEGVAEVVGKIGAMTYMLDAARRFTVGAVDSGLKPAVISAIMKYNATEMARKIINDAMDVCGGAGISKGPSNLLAHSYESAPIGITVEGANILTRTMIIFGQGAIRCHPYAYKEVTALTEGDAGDFDKAFMGHIGHVVRNASRAIVLSMTRGFFAKVPSGPFSSSFKKLSWASASFAFMADVAMAGFGGSLKFKESVTGRFSDILSWMYLITATLRRYEAEGRLREHTECVQFVSDYGFAKIQEAFDGLFANMDLPVIGKIFKYPVALWSRMNPIGCMPKDALTHGIAQKMSQAGGARDSITAGMFLPKEEKEALYRLEEAFQLSNESEQIMRNISRAIRNGVLSKGRPNQRIEEALSKGVITAKDEALLRRSEEACEHAVQVDSFTLAEYGTGVMNSI